MQLACCEGLKEIDRRDVGEKFSGGNALHKMGTILFSLGHTRCPHCLALLFWSQAQQSQLFVHYPPEGSVVQKPYSAIAILS